MPFAQIVLGPPGSGKTTYCNGMQQFLQANHRDVAVVNMDPANEQLPYVADVDVSEMVCLENVMEELDLGPNGGLVYCMDYIDVNFDWLEDKLAALKDNVHSILHKLQKLGYRLAVVHLVDAHHCTDSSKFVSVVMLSLSSMVRLELPHINVLSKIDLMQQYGKLAFNLDFYTDVLDLRYLLDRLDEPDDAEDEDQISLEPRHTTAPNSRLAERFRRMNEALVDVIEDFSLVSFLPLQIQDPATIQKVVAAIDKASGFVFTGVDFQTAVVKDYAFGDQSAPDIQEKYLDQ
ncbi:hypothetical protein PC118_g11236 [Phytophthora cactorum]|uniref:GPN-loop GTPase 2 n=1 Tax=Phytophthora cactorum TaxID=29920 RepID=A0A8T1FZ98_9STRA|nr:hypothetical protein PC111_g9967 [Phytophthora cactorum]KAG2903264.1 hypothetical protein PC114_g12356 [Phytophthora cactorum]KAG2917998.1 hypothetical protein PC115_g10592 [Phytophthora cactorum]KAG2980353.1 hypothetical protein PC118_g11236 [Phytophthora cactorum]KAG3015333.1 hypothetical protein PC119_g11831 [Phytophthora cactorum]